MARPIVRETIVDRRTTPVRWGAVFAGTVTAVGLWILLQLLGTGIGLSFVDTAHGDNLRDVGIGTGVWSLVAPLIALFLGALVGARLAGTRDRKVGALHGMVMWALTTVVGVFAVISTISAIATGVGRVGTTVVAAAGNAAKVIAPAAAPDSSDMLAPINDYLRQQGKPPLTEAQLRATVRGVAKRGLHEGQIDREDLVDEIAQDTSMSKQDAQDLADRFGDRYDEAVTSMHQKVDEVKAKAKQAGLDAAHASGLAMFWAGIAMVVALLAALGGGALGVPRYREAAVVTTTETVPPVVPPPPPAP